MKKLCSCSLIQVSIIVCFLLSACTATRLSPTERYHLAAKDTLDAIIVPGAPFINYKLDSVLKGRILWAWILWKNGVTKNVIFSGAAVYTPFIEAQVMGRYAMEMGIPEANIYYDTLAEHSTENVYYSYLLAKQLGFKKLGLASDPFQSLTLRSLLKRRFASPIMVLPFVVDSLSKYNYKNPIIAVKGLLRQPWSSIQKRQSFWYRWKGTLGKNIPWSQYPQGRVPEL